MAVVLSAQCTDKRINQVTPALFSRFPDASDMAKVEVDEVYEYMVKVCLSSKNYEEALATIAKIKNKTAEMQSAWQRVAYFRGL